MPAYRDSRSVECIGPGPDDWTGNLMRSPRLRLIYPFKVRFGLFLYRLDSAARLPAAALVGRRLGGGGSARIVCHNVYAGRLYWPLRSTAVTFGAMVLHRGG